MFLTFLKCISHLKKKIHIKFWLVSHTINFILYVQHQDYSFRLLWRPSHYLITLFLRKKEFCQRSSWRNDFLKTQSLDQTLLLHQSLLCSIFHHIFKNQIFKSIYSSVTLKSKVCFSGNLALKCNSIMKNRYWSSSGMKNKEKDTCIHWRNVFSSSPLLIEDYSTFLHAYKRYMLQTFETPTHPSFDALLWHFLPVKFSILQIQQ